MRRTKVSDGADVAACDEGGGVLEGEGDLPQATRSEERSMIALRRRELRMSVLKGKRPDSGARFLVSEI
jgi:hypothetical protein